MPVLIYAIAATNFFVVSNVMKTPPLRLASLIAPMLHEHLLLCDSLRSSLRSSQKLIPSEHLTKGNVIAIEETKDGEAEVFWEVETVMGKRKKGSRVEYLVKWKVRVSIFSEGDDDGEYIDLMPSAPPQTTLRVTASRTTPGSPLPISATPP